MKKELSKVALAIGFALAMALTFSCSGDGGGDDPDGSSSAGGGSSATVGGDVSSSSGGGTGQSSVIHGTPVTYGNETYETIVIGEQTWMARNLNYDVPDDDTDVCYDNDPANCAMYGRLYKWTTAMGIDSIYNTQLWGGSDAKYRARGGDICPSGWHIPSIDEWNTLMEAVGDPSTAGKYLKATSGWTNNGNGTDEYGFSALPGGTGGYDVGRYGGWWSSIEYTTNNYYAGNYHYNNAYIYGMSSDTESAGSGYSGKSDLHSVRCLQDTMDGDDVSSSSGVETGQSGVIHGTPVTYGNETYETIVIGEQTWMARNLNYDVPDVDTDVCYDNDPANCATYGRLYNWATAMGIDSKYNRTWTVMSYEQQRGICPSGWHIPSAVDWGKLINYVTGDGNLSSAGRYLKARSGWNNNENGEDMYGFSALPRASGDVGNHGVWWGANATDSDLGFLAYTMALEYRQVRVGYGSLRISLLSVRCVQD